MSVILHNPVKVAAIAPRKMILKHRVPQVRAFLGANLGVRSP